MSPWPSPGFRSPLSPAPPTRSPSPTRPRTTRPRPPPSTPFRPRTTRSDPTIAFARAVSLTDRLSRIPGATPRRDDFYFQVGQNRNKSTRLINFSGTSAFASSKVDGRQWLADLTADRHFEAGCVSRSPFAGLLAGGWKTKGFTATGAGAFNASVEDQSAHSLRTQLGLEAALDFKIGSAGLRPHARAVWLHELTNHSRPIHGSFSGSDFTVHTRKADRDTLRAGVGIQASRTHSLSLYADYAIQPGDSASVSSQWNGGVSLRF